MAGTALSSWDMESTESRLRGLHNDLSVVLSGHITEDQFTKLKQHFRLRPFGDGTLEKIKGFLKFWNELETTGLISVQRYDNLEHAFESIQASCQNDVIKEYKELMWSEGTTKNGWVRHDEITLTRAEFDVAVVEYKTSMEKLGPRFGTVHIFENAVLGLIPRSGGELRLKNGTAKLEIPSGAIQNKDQEMFWIFRPPADAEGSHLAICRQKQSLQNINLVKYSLPVTLGPPDVAFRKTALPKLTLKEYSFPYSTNGSAPLSVYRRTGDNGTWERVGSCFLDKESRLATVSLAKFSSYVVGLPVMSELIPLNIHIMVERLPKKTDDTSQRCDMQVMFSMNDHTYIQEMVLRKRMNIVCETSYYLDPKSDVNIRLENRNAGGSVYLKQTAVLGKGRLNRLAEKMQSVTISIQDEQQLVEDRDILVILEQHGTDLVELFCRDDRPMKKEEITPKDGATAWTRTDELVSCLDSLGDHCKNGRGKEANKVALKIQQNGALFQEGIDGVNNGLKEVFEKKKESLEAMQEKLRGFEDLRQSLNKKIKEIEETIDCDEQIVRLYEEREKHAEDEYSQGWEELDEWQKQMYEKRWYGFVPILCQAAKIGSMFQGGYKVLAAVAKMNEAIYEKDHAQSSLKDAIKHKEKAETKLSEVRKLKKEMKQKIDGLHQDLTTIKATMASSLEIGGVLEELLVYTDKARGKTDRLTTILSQYATKPGALRSRGTGSMLAAHERLWEDVKSAMQTILTGENAYIFQEAALRMKKRTILKEILSLFATLRDIITEARDVDELQKCLKKLEAKGANFLDCIRRELESVRNRREQLQIEIKTTEEDDRLRDQLEKIGLGTRSIGTDRTYNRVALSSKMQLQMKMCKIEANAQSANDRICRLQTLARPCATSKDIKQLAEGTQREWQEIEDLVMDIAVEL